MHFKSIIYALSCLILVIDFGECVASQKTSSKINHNVVRTSKPNDKYRILGLFAHPGKSHFDVFRPLLEELGRRGHDVTVISYFPRDNRKNQPMSNYHDISLANSSSDIFVNVVDLEVIKHSPVTTFIDLMMLRKWAIINCETGLQNPEVQKLIKSDVKFDLIITEGFNSDCFLAFVHRFKAPFITLSSHQLMPWVNRRFSNEDNPSYIPAILNGYPPTMTLFERTINAVTVLIYKIAYELTFNPSMQSIVEAAFGPDVPPLSEIAKNTSLALVNTHYSLHGSKPNLPNIIEVGGIHISPIAEPLPTELQRFLDEAKEGVLYFNLGSMIKASTMPKDKLQAIVNVIGTIPRKVIWKWEASDFPNKPSNLFISKWLPQAAILRHPNVKCFMAHGGLLGISEGVQAGIPMVVIPMYGDQFHNAAAAKGRGVAEIIKWSEFSEITLRRALDLIFNDTSYAINARALSKAYTDRPESPVETAVWWTEYIARGNGIPYLRSAAQDLTWYQYYLIDVVLLVAAMVLTTLYIVYRLSKFVLARFNQRRNPASVNGRIPSNKKTTKRE